MVRKNFSILKILQRNLMFFSMLSFVFISTFTLSLSLKSIEVVEIEGEVKGERTIYPKRPVLRENFSSFPILSGQAVLAMDIDSGVTLYEKNPDQALLPASTTKIFTSMVAMDGYDLEQTLKITGISVDGQKMGLIEGEEISVGDLLYGLLVFSANDAAEVLAQNYCADQVCGRDKFVEMMNKKAQDLGLRNTKFENPSGLDGQNQRSTARDLVLASIHAMKNQFFKTVVGTKEHTVQSIDGKHIHKLRNINELLGVEDGVLGIKTGWTHNARENLVTYTEKDGRKIMIAILGSQGRFGETKELLDWIYENYTWEDVVYSYRP